MPTRDLGAEHRAHGAMHVADRQLCTYRLSPLECRLAQRDELDIEGAVEPMVLLDHATPRGPGRSRRMKNRREVKALGLPVAHRRRRIE